MTAVKTNDFVISRVVNAPRDLVWQAWTQADHLQKWWGPKGSAIRVLKFDLKPGGIFHYSMEFQPGQPMYGRFVYREISTPEKLSFINSFSDEQGGVTRAPFPQLKGGWPLEVLNNLSLEETGGKTTLRGYPINAMEEECALYESMFDSMRQGFGGSFEQLDEHLAGRR